jgi:hypothetical protein
LGPPSFHHLTSQRQESRRPRRARRCLLKGCECWFAPAYPQSRYCSPACREAARRWRRAQASRRYRASAAGRQRRRAQQRRYRQRRRQRTAASADGSASREGQRPACPGEDFVECLCARPGCYITFWAKPVRSSRRFCSLACRLALRRVLDREASYRQRRRRWRRERRTRRRQRPDTS